MYAPRAASASNRAFLILFLYDVLIPGPRRLGASIGGFRPWLLPMRHEKASHDRYRRSMMIEMPLERADTDWTRNLDGRVVFSALVRRVDGAVRANIENRSILLIIRARSGSKCWDARFRPPTRKLSPVVSSRFDSILPIIESFRTST